MIKCRFDVMAIFVYTKLFIYLFYLMCFREEERKSLSFRFFFQNEHFLIQKLLD